MNAQLKKASRPPTGKLPDFIIAGIMKSGTSSLFVNLSKHPRIEMSPNAVKHEILEVMGNTKESNFFIDKWSKGVKWYKGLFNDNGKIQGEAASNYLFSEEYIKRMASVVPHAKIIVSLRDPVARAYSQYNHNREYYRRSLSRRLPHLEHNKDLFIRMAKLRNISFDEMIKKEISKGVIAGSGIIGKGLYINLIEDLLKYYPRKQVLIIISEHMKRDMRGTYNKIFDFLGVKRAQINFDMDVLVRKYEKPMSQRTKKILNKIYNLTNERLFDFLGHQAPEWGY